MEQPQDFSLSPVLRLQLLTDLYGIEDSFDAVYDSIRNPAPQTSETWQGRLVALIQDKAHNTKAKIVFGIDQIKLNGIFKDLRPQSYAHQANIPEYLNLRQVTVLLDEASRINKKAAIIDQILNDKAPEEGQWHYSDLRRPDAVDTEAGFRDGKEFVSAFKLLFDLICNETFHEKKETLKEFMPIYMLFKATVENSLVLSKNQKDNLEEFIHGFLVQDQNRVEKAGGKPLSLLELMSISLVRKYEKEKILQVRETFERITNSRVHIPGMEFFRSEMREAISKNLKDYHDGYETAAKNTDDVDADFEILKPGLAKDFWSKS